MIERNKQESFKVAPLTQPLQSVSCGNQTLIDSQITSKMIPLECHSVVKILETMIYQEKHFLNEEALHQEGMRLYCLIEPLLPFQRFRGAGMSPEIVRSFVLQALRKSGSSLGVETVLDKLFLLWSRDSQ